MIKLFVISYLILTRFIEKGLNFILDLIEVHGFLLRVFQNSNFSFFDVFENYYQNKPDPLAIGFNWINTKRKGN